jgi:hypothetical protein
MSFQDGADDVKIIGGPISFYEEYQTTTLYVARALGGQCHSLTVTNDSLTDTVSVSFDGATLEADLKAGESLTLNTTAKTSVYIKGDAGGDNVRIWGW